MFFQDVFRNTVHFLAEAERNAALNERLRGEINESDRVNEAANPGRRVIVRSHAALLRFRSRDADECRRE